MGAAFSLVEGGDGSVCNTKARTRATAAPPAMTAGWIFCSEVSCFFLGDCLEVIAERGKARFIATFDLTCRLLFDELRVVDFLLFDLSTIRRLGERAIDFLVEKEDFRCFLATTGRLGFRDTSRLGFDVFAGFLRSLAFLHGRHEIISSHNECRTNSNYG